MGPQACSPLRWRQASAQALPGVFATNARRHSREQNDDGLPLADTS